MIGMLLGVALDTYLYADPSRPVFVDANTPFRRDRRWGGDNTDAYYCLAPIDAQRTYRISGRAGDSAYFSMTVYNEPSPGSWSDRVIGVLRDTDLDVQARRHASRASSDRPAPRGTTARSSSWPTTPPP